MKKKIIICLICVLGLFSGLTCFAWSDNINEYYTDVVYLTETYDDIDDLVADVMTNGSNLSSGGDYSAKAITLYEATYDHDQYIVCIVCDTIDYQLKFMFTPLGNYDTTYSVNIDGNESYYQLDLPESINLIKNNDTTQYLSGIVISDTVENGNIGTYIIEGLASLMSSIGLMFVNIFTAAVGIVYSSSTGLTTVGWLMLIGLGIALFMFGLRFIKGLINKARAR